ncbi:MAG: 50S ribosomal protein L10 [Nitriliruptoraceae bacterium]|nr:50S ribosomal protein L10 [Nitriliruptoraceae bacterium]
MARPDKVAKVAEVKEDLAGAAATLLTHYRGLSVTELAELRAKLREANAEMRVVKNTLTRRAAKDAGIEGLDDYLVGPTGLVFCAEDPVGPAKALKAFQKDHPDLIIRGGYLDGEVLDEAEALRLADLDSREDLLAKLAGLMDGALSNTARLLQAATEKQARLMAALVDAGGVEAKGFSPEPAEAAAPADAPEASDAPVEEAPAADAPEASDAPAEEAPAEEAPEASDAPAEDTPAADAADEDAPAEDKA